MKRIISKLQILIVLALVVVALVKTTHIASAQTAPEQLQKYGITFPIQDLGNCADVASCRSFCEDPLNRETCINFAKSKGFYKDRNQNQQAVLENAKKELGCDSIDSCKIFCQKEENLQKCKEFGTKNGLTHQNALDSQKDTILQKAKAALGCDSVDACKAVCSLESNKKKCSDFAKDVNLKGGTESRGPGNCKSEKTCQAYCADPANFKECAKFAPPGHGLIFKEGFKGPGECDSESSCRAYCAQNPAACQMRPKTRPQNQTNTKDPYQTIDCPRPDGQRFQTTQKECPNPNALFDRSSGSSKSPFGAPGQNPNIPPREDPANICSKSGGQWTGSTCKF